MCFRRNNLKENPGQVGLKIIIHCLTPKPRVVTFCYLALSSFSSSPHFLYLLWARTLKTNEEKDWVQAYWDCREVKPLRGNMPDSDNNKGRKMRSYSCLKFNIQRPTARVQNVPAKGTYWRCNSRSPEERKNIWEQRSWMKGISWQLLLAIARGFSSLFFSQYKEGKGTPRGKKPKLALYPSLPPWPTFEICGSRT